MDKFLVTVDGQPLDADEGETILQLAKRHNISDRIPTLCYEPALPPYTSCYLCVVEAEGQSRLLPACSTRVVPGMVLYTSNPRVEDARRLALELLMSAHPADCVAPCSRGCPAGIDVQRYLAFARNGDYAQAIKTIREKNPLPLVCGRVCVRKCEEVCRRTKYDDPVGINMVKRTASDWWVEHPYDEQPGPDSGKAVAIVGGGPAGLTAAYFLRKAGHRVSLFDMQSRLGGMLRWGIPDYRLPQGLLDYEIQQTLKLGVSVHTDTWVGRDVNLAQLRESHDAVFLALGAQLGSSAHIKGEDHDQVLAGVDFLEAVKKDHDFEVAGKRVVVVGGGNTAIDASRTCLRLGARHVTILYRRTRLEMPANPEEIEAAEEEGVRIEFLIAPLEVRAEDDRLSGLVCEKMELGEPDKSGRRRPVPVPGSEHFVACDLVITAIGQAVDLSGLVEQNDSLGVSRWGTIEADTGSTATNLAAVFAGGDAVTGPAVVIDAIGWGRRAAASIDHFFKVGRVTRVKERFSVCRENFGEIRKTELPPATAIKRHALPMVPLDERMDSFDEVELTLDDHETREEASRCLSCGCSAAQVCELRSLCDRYGLADSVSGQVPIHRVDYAHPYIVMDPNKCILCTRCVRTCGDILGVSALGLVNRGFDTVISPAIGRPLTETNCVSCGNCVEACPTGALTFKDLARSQTPDTVVDSVCTLCGELCSMKVGKGRFGASFRTERAADGKRLHLCGLGRFGHDLYLGAERIRGPLVRRGSTLVPATYEEALKVAVEGMMTVGTSRGTSSVLVSGGPDLSCQEAAWLAHLGQTGFGANTGSLSAIADDAELYALDATFGATGSTASVRDLEAADVIIVVTEDPMERNPVAAARLRRAMRNGARVLAITSSRSPLHWQAEVHVEARRGTASLVLGWLLKKILDEPGRTVQPEAAVVRQALAECTRRRLAAEAGVREDVLDSALELLRAAAGPVVALYPIDCVEERSPDCPVLLAQILEVLRGSGTGSGLLFTQHGANLMGLKMAGLMPQTREKYISLTESLEHKKYRAAWIVRENPRTNAFLNEALNDLEFLVVQGTFLTQTASTANVVFPASSHLETGGTFIRFDGKIQTCEPALPMVLAKTTADVIADACTMLGLHASPESPMAMLQKNMARCSSTMPVRHFFRWLPPRPGIDTRAPQNRTVSTAPHFIRSRLPVRV